MNVAAAGTTVKARSVHGFLYVAATEDRLDVSAIATTGGVSDHFALTR